MRSEEFLTALVPTYVSFYRFSFVSLEILQIKFVLCMASLVKEEYTYTAVFDEA